MSDGTSAEERRQLLGELLRQRREQRRVRPVSFAQRRLWFLDQLLPDGTLYNICFAFRLRGRLDVAVLERSLDAILARHEVLRTTFESKDGEPVQTIAESQRLELEVEDRTAVPAAGRELDGRARARDLGSRPIDLARGPLIRGRLLRWADDDHALVLVIHHIAYDGWSSGIFLRELTALYAAYAAGRPSPLPPLALQYGDFAVAQRERLRDERLEEHLAYWRRTLAGASILELPTDHARPPVPRHASERQSTDLPASVAESLEALGRQAGVTLFSTVLAILKVLLHRYTGQADIVVGSPIAGRNLALTESLIGCFVNSLVLRTDLSGDPTFRELLGRVRETALGAFEHEELPFEKLVEALQPERDMSRNPFFQVLYSFQGASDFAADVTAVRGADPLPPALSISPMELESGSTRLDLEVYAFRGPAGLRLLLNYRTDLFERDTIERMLQHFATLARGVASDPGRRLSELPLLGDDERRLLLETWNDSALELPPERCVHALVAAQAARTPQAVAVVFGEQRLSFAELQARAGRLEQHLRDLGVGPGDLVGIFLERSPTMVVALLGVLQSGAAYVPLDPSYPEDRIGFMLADAQVALLLTTADLVAALPEHDARVQCLDGEAAPVAGAGPAVAQPGTARDVAPHAAEQPVARTAPDARGRAAGPEDLVYVMYTSGSTGRPKGVAVPHRAVVNLLASMRRAPGLLPQDVLLSITTLSFDIAVLEIFLPLITGARLVLVSRDEAGDGATLRRRIDEVGATVLQATPATWRLLLEAGWQGDGRLKAICGGEAWGWDLAGPMVERCSSVWNGYGPTEATVYASMRAVRREERRVCMGGPVGNGALYVLDEHRQPVPIGVPGELCIGGAGVAHGYLRRPELTAEKFVADPFSATPGARLYRTGDKVRWRADGTIEFLGRLDHQIKLRGFRIEPGEIQDALSRHPCAAEVVVVVREDRPGDQRLVAYVVTRGEALPSGPELRAFLRERLPEYMVPSLFLRLPAFPLTPSGKVDRKALPVPEADRPELGTERVAPQGPVQELLAGLWSAVLGLPGVGARDNFFDLGGHSLLATKLVSRIRDEFEVELPLAALFTSPTVAELAARIEALRRGGAARTLPPLVARVRTAPAPDVVEAPLSFQQWRLWFLQQLEPDSAGYTMSTVHRLHGELDGGALGRALQALVERHEALRTTFPAVDGRPAAHIAAHLELPLATEDLAGLPDAAREAAVAERTRAEAGRSFDLARGPLVHATLLRLGEREHVFVLAMHHILSDAWSLDVLYRELSVAYAAERAGRPVALPPLALQYADYAEWQQALLTGDVLDDELAWWRDYLRGAPPALDLPTDRARPRVQRPVGGSETLAVSADTVRALRGLGQAENASLFMVLLAAFEVLLRRSSGVEDLVVGMPISGRNHTGVEGLVGFFINTLVLRGDLSGKPTFRELLRRVRRSTLEAFSHQEIPFEKLVEELAPARDLSRNPIFQVFVNLIDVTGGGGGLQLPGVRAEAVGGAMEIAKFDLTLYLFTRGDELSVRLNYNADLFEAATIRAMLRHYATLLEAIVADAAAHAERPITALPLLSAEERARLAGCRNADVVVHDFAPFDADEVEQSVGERFVAQVRRDPARIAAQMLDRAWTYGELEALARRTAAAVLCAVDARRAANAGGDAGIGAEPQRVALLFHPGGNLLAGTLGVLLSGHAYVPLDPHYPERWLRFVLDDTAAVVIVTERRCVEDARRVAGSAIVIDIDALPDGPAAEAIVGANGCTSTGANGAGCPVLPRVPPDALAYIRYTSGSTGQPKGVMQSHRGLLAHIAAYTNSLHIAAGDRLSALSSYTHDGGLMDIYGALLNGATLCPLPIRERTPQESVAAIEALGITLYHSTPSAFRHLFGGSDGATVGGVGAATRRLRAVRLVVFGGEEPRPEDLLLQRRHFARGCWLVNGLGSTESSQGLQAFLDHDAPTDRRRLPVGLPIAGTQAVLLDADGAETDVFGELGLRSDHLAAGYWKRPEQTAAVFSPGPAGRGQVRQYRTGDLVRRLPDGRFEWLGRKDGQVKIRGHRVETGEVAAALGALPGVAQAVVAARPDDSGDLRLVGYVVPDGSAAVAPASLRGALREQLPEPLLPSAIVLLDRLPTTPGGKLDRAALPAPDWSDAQRTGNYQPPTTATEQRLAEIYGEVLGVELVGARDHFFELGGHSLLATQVISRVRDSLQVALPLLELFEEPTVAGLARRIDARRQRRAGAGADGNPLANAPAGADRGADRSPSAEDMPDADGDELAPAPPDATPVLSFGQQRFWFLEQLQTGTAALNMHAAWGLGGALDVEALRRALTAIVGRHAVLRTSFPKGADGEPQCRVTAPAPLELPVTDLSAPDDAEARDARMRSLAADEARTPFDIAAGPLLRVRLVRLSGAEHVLLVTVHHMVSDAWSVGIFWRELVALYAAFTAGQPSPLPDLPLQYGDVAHWQRRWLGEARLKRQLDYWTTHLAGAPPLLELPTDRPRPALEGFEGARCSRLLPPALAQGLKGLARRQDATLFMVLLAGFQALLARCSGQDDIVVGAPIAGRTRAQTENLIGLFVNSLVLRTDLSGDPTFGELVQRVRRVSLGAFAHQELPFERLVQALRPPRDLSHHPLFQVQFVLQNAPRERVSLPGLELTPLGTARTTSQFDLTLYAWEVGGQIALTAEYKTGLFDADTIAGLLEQLQTLLAGAVAEPERPVSRLPLLGAEARERVLAEGSGAGLDVPPALTVHELVERQVARTPEAPAVEFEGAVLSYAELERRACDVSRRLRAQGIGRGARVGLCVERGLALLPGLLGILKAGAAYVPLDPTHPPERLAFILADAEVHALVTQSALRERLQVGDLPVLLLDDAPGSETAGTEALDERGGAGSATPGGADADAGAAVSSDDLAYLIYTSGSTGRPKGVQIPHGAVVNFLLSMQQSPGLRADDVLLSVTTVAFDIAVLELFGPLTVGGKVVLMPAAVAADGVALEAALARSRATLCQATPATWRLLLELRWAGDRRLRILCGGEAWTRALADALLPRCGALWNMYGPTETTVWSAVQRVEAGTAPVAIGTPIANTQLHVLDAHGEVLPVGVPGELCIGGAGLARGYWRRPELTAERFVPHPFDATPGARLYRTGDRARRRADGTIEFLGRLDHQVKVNGFRIELGEIESVLGSHPQVREAVVVAREFGAGDTRLVAYATTTGDALPPIAELREALREKLPEYMVPGLFLRLPAFPLTPSGKVDRKALPAPDGGEAQRSGSYQPPTTATEQRLAEIYAEVLGVAQVGAGDHFFELGGHSLLATQVISRVRDSLQVALPLLALFEEPTVAGLARRIDARRQRRAAARAGVAGVVGQAGQAGAEGETGAAGEAGAEGEGGDELADDGDELAPAPAGATPVLSFGQQRFWFLEQLQAGTAALNMHTAWRLGGALDVPALRRALAEIVRRHAVLRTSFPEGPDGEPQCRVASPAPLDMPLTDLSAPEGEASSATERVGEHRVPADSEAQALDAAARESRLQALASDEARLSFDIAAGPLLRVRLVRLSGAEHVLLVTVHHMVSDAWSVGIFGRELVALYTAFAAGQPSPLPELPLQYADVALWQRRRLAGPRLARQLDYWTAQLAGAPPLLELPTDRLRPALESFEGARCESLLDPALTAACKRLARQHDATLFMVLLAGFQALLARCSGQDDIVVGAPIAGRTRAQTENLIGLFVNSLVLRTDLSGDPTFGELLSRVRRTSLGAFAHQELPFERLVQALRPPRDLSHHPLFQVLLVLQNAPRERVTLPGLELATLGTARTTSQFDLSLYVWEVGGQLALLAEYKTALFDAGTVAGLLDQFRTLLGGLVAEPALPISRVRLLEDAERRRLLDQGSGHAAALPEGATLHGLIEQQVARTPAAAAVESEGRVVSYAALDARARDVARRLGLLGIGRGARVGVCLERSPELVATLLGILKSGAAYVPLDPTHPPERLAFILADAEVQALVTQRALRERLRVGDVPVLLLDDLSADAAAAEENAEATKPGTSRREAMDAHGGGESRGSGHRGSGTAARGDSGAAADAAVPVTPDDLAYLIYTSGSTGRPKGVQIPHRAVVNFLLSMQRTPGLRADDVLLSVTTVAFDIAVLELFGPLSVGAKVILVPAAVAADGVALEALLSRSRATLCQATPATWRLLLELRWAGDRRLRILCGGEAWTRSLADALLPRCGALWNMYGPTETTVWSAVQRVEAGSAPVAIGTPIANTQLHVLDAHGEVLPVGVPGELCIGGAGLARGYWKRPELTAERFVPHPFDATPGARLYRTGDRVRRRADGTLEFLGRLDHQVKVNGFRIELGEIESVLGSHPQVREAVVVAREFGAGDTRLVAYVVPDPARRPSTSELQEMLRERLPDSMVPSIFVELEALPRTPNAKVDRAVLPVPERARPRNDAADRKPGTPLEKQLAAIWKDLLQVEEVSVLDNFFDLGGHSLLSMRVVARFEKETGVRISPGELILQTLGQVAAACERAGAAGTVADRPDVTATTASSPLPTTPPGTPTESTPRPGWLRRLLGRGGRPAGDG